VFDCSENFARILEGAPNCKTCLETSCAAEVANCGTTGCSQWMACYADPVAADFEVPNGACAGSSERWPLYCYLVRQECVDLGTQEPAATPFVGCMVQNCPGQCLGVGPAGPCPAPPSCSVLAN
jgi:hypothetical protein